MEINNNIVIVSMAHPPCLLRMLSTSIRC